uniref:Retrotransposon gag domain-containing protein n=1 Tax=Tanacetum cinerariifolium TaxID=118510 RepID=A0A6L2K5A5_TANCI|nr:hypothetical protein [Tanacetum cinerariifolium]
MADQRTMAELLRAPTEGYAEAIVDNPLDHIRWFNKITSTIKYKDVPNSEDLVSKFINEFFPPSRTTNLRNEISNFQQRFDESFHEACDRYKDLLHACPHHGFTKLHQLDTFYNALNPADQDSLNAAAGRNLLERRTHDVLMIIENKSKVRNSRNKSVVSQVKSCDANSNSSSEIAKLTHAVNQQTSAVTTTMTAILKQFQATPPPTSVKVVEEFCVTCGGAHLYYQCLAAGGNTFPELRDNIQGYVSAAAVNYNQGNSIYRPPCMGNQIRPPDFAQPNVQNNQNQFGQPQGFNCVKKMNEADMKAMQTQINMVKNELRNEMKILIQASLSNQTNEIKNMMASLLQMNTASTSGSGSLLSNIVANPKGKLKAITTRSGLVVDGPTVPTPPPFINLEEDERVEETLTNSDLFEYTIKVPPPPVQKYKPPSQIEYVVHQRDPLHPNILYPSRMLKQKQQEKDEKMLKALLSNKEKLQELANTPLNENCLAVIQKKLPEKLGDPGKFLIPCGFSELKCKALADLADFVIVDYESDPRGSNVLPEKLLDLDSTKDLHPPLHVNQLSGSTTYSSNPLLEEFADDLALITFPLKYDDYLHIDVEFDLKEIEFLLYQDIDSSLKDSIDQSNLADIFVDSMLEMFTDEHAPDYSSPLIFDEYDDDFLEFESDAEKVYDDPFDSKGEKIKESKLLIDELDLPCYFLPSDYDSFISEDFSRVDSKPSTNNEDKVFNPGILIQENPFEIITRVDKKLASSNASSMLVDFDPPFYEPLFFKEVPRSNMLLPFSSKFKEKVFKPGIHTSEKVHSSFIPELSH